jgi:futalosine hydrolase
MTDGAIRPVDGAFLVCAATQFELDAMAGLRADGFVPLVIGVGIPQALRSLYRRLSEGDLPPLLLCIGIAGAYKSNAMSIGDIVVGGSEVYGDVGFELPEAPGFMSVAEASFGSAYREPMPLATPDRFSRVGARVNAGRPYGIHVGLRGCTVNTCAGSDATGAMRAQRFDAAFESMEGAAVAQVGVDFGIPVCEVRSISNFAARRDMRAEHVRIAVDNLAHYLRICFETGTSDAGVST